MKKYNITLLFILLTFTSIAQENIDYEDDTIVPIESQRNYFGANISPLMTGIISERNNYDIKVNVLYKRNYGEKNLRFSLNHLTEGNNLQYDYYQPTSSTDTSITRRYFNSSYYHYDFRFGFEELRGFSGSRVHVGLDGIIGLGSQRLGYFNKVFTRDSIGNYIPTDIDLTNDGERISNYLITGLDVSFGIDWVLNEAFIFTMQITPQFNYYIFRNNSTLIDPANEYADPINYADFKLGYFDINLIYRF